MSDSDPLQQQLRIGANWFYWIAALSTINSLIQLFGGNHSFIVGLGLTQLFDGVAAGPDGQAAGVGAVRVFAFALDLIVAGFFVLLGWHSNHRRAWAFLIGMTLYALDGFLFLMVSDFLSLGFHAFALYGVWRGYAALKALHTAEVSSGVVPVEPGRA